MNYMELTVRRRQLSSGPLGGAKNSWLLPGGRLLQMGTVGHYKRIIELAF